MGLSAFPFLTALHACTLHRRAGATVAASGGRWQLGASHSAASGFRWRPRRAVAAAAATAATEFGGACCPAPSLRRPLVRTFLYSGLALCPCPSPSLHLPICTVFLRFLLLWRKKEKDFLVSRRCRYCRYLTSTTLDDVWVNTCRNTLRNTHWHLQ